MRTENGKGSAVFRIMVVAALLLGGPVVVEGQTSSPAEDGGVPSFDVAGESPDTIAVLDLEMAQRRALRDNPSLKSVAERLAQARQRVHQARSLYFPQLDASYSATRTWLPDATVNAARDAAMAPGISSLSRSLATLVTAPTQPGTIGQVVGGEQALFQSIKARNQIDATAESYGLSFSAGWLIFDGLSREFGHAMARFGMKETAAAQREAVRLLLSSVAQSYYGVQLARENIAIARGDEAFNARLLKEAQARRRVGVGSLSDVLNFEVRLRAAQTAVLLAESEHETARIALAALMGIPDATLPPALKIAELGEEDPGEMRPPDSEEAVGHALHHRPDLLQGRYGLKRAKANVLQQGAAFSPQVSVFASQDATRSLDSRFEGDDFSTTIGVSVSYNLFSGGRRWAAVSEAKHARRQAEHDLANAELNVVGDVRRALVGLRTSQEQLVLQRTTAEYVKKNRELAEKEYRAGQGALALLNQAQRDLIEAQGRLALARVSLRQAWYAVRTSTAETLADFEAEE